MANLILASRYDRSPNEKNLRRHYEETLSQATAPKDVCAWKQHGKEIFIGPPAKKDRTPQIYMTENFRERSIEIDWFC